jgi:hypothetical protein
VFVCFITKKFIFFLKKSKVILVTQVKFTINVIQ